MRMDNDLSSIPGPQKGAKEKCPGNGKLPTYWWINKKLPAMIRHTINTKWKKLSRPCATVNREEKVEMNAD